MNDYLALHARLQPRAPAVQDLTRDHTWSYQECDRLVSRYATLLRHRGVTRGDRLAVLAKNRAELPLLHLACARLGAMYVPLNWRLSGAELDSLVRDAQPRLVLGDAQLQQSALAGLPLDEFAAAAGGVDALPAGDAPPDTAPDPDAPSLILYTSGTSGHPKGVLLSENNIAQTALNFSVLGRVTHASVVLCDSPMFHIIGLITNIRPALMRGGRVIISDGFLAARTLARLTDPTLGITHYFCVPQMAAMLRADPNFDADKLRGLTGLFSGGGPHAPDAIRAWIRTGIPMSDGFGMSEAGTVSCMPLDIGLIDSHAGSAGMVPPGLQVRIVDAAGEECPMDAPGEILVKGPGVTAGYWRRPQETQAAFTADGWLKTGDVGRLDAEGFLWLLDRKKDMFISGGENVYPAEIEGALAAYPGLLECAVIGVPDPRWGEVGHLVVVPAPGGSLDPEALIAHLGQCLARYKLPKHVSIVEKLPRNGAGKILKSRLRAALGSPPGG